MRRIKKWSIIPGQLFHEASNKSPELLVVLRDFGRREAEKLVTHRENNGSDNFFCIGGVGSVNMHQLDQSPSAHPRVYLTLDERIEPKVRKFKNN